MPQDSATASAKLQLPVALVRLWEAGVSEGLALARTSSAKRPGIYWPEPHLCAIVPIARDAAIFDAAIALAEELFALVRSHDGAVRSSVAGGPPVAGLKLLVLPGWIRLDDGRVTVLPNPLLEELVRKAPLLELGKVYLTTYSQTRLEVRRKVKSAGFYQGTLGLRVPLVQVTGESAETMPARNPELLRRKATYIPRGERDSLLAAPTRWLRVSGPMGCGKTRALWENLEANEPAVLWNTFRPERHFGPSLLSQLLHRALAWAQAHAQQLPSLGGLGARAAALTSHPDSVLKTGGLPPLLEDTRLATRFLTNLFTDITTTTGRPVVAVLDSLESATTGDLGALEALLEAVQETRAFRIVAAGRPGAPWPREWPVPQVEIHPLPDEGAFQLAAQLTAGLSMPEKVRSRMLEAAAGNPFALEEGLAALVHRQLIRQVYGSFFFRGNDASPYAPSDRLVQHAASEAERLGWPLASRLLAVAETPLPPRILTAASGSLDTPPVERWEQMDAVQGWAIPAASPWGEGLRLVCPAFGSALAATLPEEVEATLRHELGRALPLEEARTAWQRYRLLARAPEAFPILLEAAEKNQASSLELYQAFCDEHRAQVERGGADHLELEMLWHLLPLARRLGKLADHRRELTRARELAAQDARRSLALAGLAADLEEAEGRIADAEATIRDSLVRTGAANDLSGMVLALRLGRLVLRQERFQEARELLERLLPHLESSPNAALRASCLFYLGNVAVHQRRLSEAKDLHASALDLRRKSEKPRAVGASLSALGRVALLDGRYPAALAHYREAEAIFVASGDKGELSYALLGIGQVLARLGDHAASSSPLRQALALRENGDDAAGEAIARLAVAENYLILKRVDDALKEARRAHFDLRLLTSLKAVLGDAEQLIARALFAKRQLAEAGRTLTEAIETHRRAGNREALLFDLALAIELAIATEDRAEVERRVAELEAGLAEGLHIERREVLDFYLYQGLAWLARQTGAPRGALPHLRAAYRGLLNKVDHLTLAQRHQFLFQVKEHQEIITAATQEGLAWHEEEAPSVRQR